MSVSSSSHNARLNTNAWIEKLENKQFWLDIINHNKDRFDLSCLTSDLICDNSVHLPTNHARHDGQFKQNIEQNGFTIVRKPKLTFDLNTNSNDDNSSVVGFETTKQKENKISISPKSILFNNFKNLIDILHEVFEFNTLFDRF
jgi:hypothetical protein